MTCSPNVVRVACPVQQPQQKIRNWQPVSTEAEPQAALIFSGTHLVHSPGRATIHTEQPSSIYCWRGSIMNQYIDAGMSASYWVD